MNLLITISTTFIMGLGLAVLMPLLSIGTAILSITGAFLLWLFPTVYYGSSDRGRNNSISASYRNL
ncbi:hypothetical protein N8303_02575 [Gammaproteobacteria bacterium]|jgi:hypothetical protein|nr:hypothetical protein [Gammaproteobacteria bacterium]